MALTPDQLRAARAALLNISQDELANASGASLTSIRQFELGGITKLQQKTESALLSYLGEKIEFIGARGVALREKDHLILEGENVIAQMFEDIHTHLRGQEGAKSCSCAAARHCLFAPELVEYCNALREAGFTYRAICHERCHIAHTYRPRKLHATSAASRLRIDRRANARPRPYPSGTRPHAGERPETDLRDALGGLPSPEAETEEDVGEPRKKALRA